jgi:hypothetical protein
LVDELVAWMRDERGKLSRHNQVANAMHDMLMPEFGNFKSKR